MILVNGTDIVTMVYGHCEASLSFLPQMQMIPSKAPHLALFRRIMNKLKFDTLESLIVIGSSFVVWCFSDCRDPCLII
jgi:hypothetical protein